MSNKEQKYKRKKKKEKKNTSHNSEINKKRECKLKNNLIA